MALWGHYTTSIGMLQDMLSFWESTKTLLELLFGPPISVDPAHCLLGLPMSNTAKPNT